MIKKTIINCIELAKNKNGLFLSEKYINNRTKYLWQCQKGHVWYATENKIHQGRWCPFCSKNVKYTLNFCNKLAENNKGFCLSEIYINKKEKLQWKCEKEHIWFANLDNVLHGKTWCPICSLHIVSKKVNNPYILYHWETNKEIVCQGSYEKKVVEYLNKNKINYLWQPQTFITPLLSKKNKRRIYTPDLYLINENMWIEIKRIYEKSQ